MNQPQATQAPADKGVDVTIRIEIATTIKGDITLDRVMERAKALKAEAQKQGGAVKVEMVLGRQKLAIG